MRISESRHVACNCSVCSSFQLGTLAIEAAPFGDFNFYKIGAAYRRRPFLVRPLENTLIKLLRSLDFHDEIGHTKIAIGEISFMLWLLANGSECMSIVTLSVSIGFPCLWQAELA